MNRDLAKQITTPKAFRFLQYLEVKYSKDTDKQLEEWSNTESFKEYCEKYENGY